MTLQGFGGYPRINHRVERLSNVDNLRSFLNSTSFFIPYGNGRSYGDSALSEKILYCKDYNRIISFCHKCGIIRAECGVTLEEILSFCINKGFFLHITPGTKYITLGGAIASNVHGKNHHYNNLDSKIQGDTALSSRDIATSSLRKDVTDKAVNNTIQGKDKAHCTHSSLRGSEAIHNKTNKTDSINLQYANNANKQMDCFVANAPRNDERMNCNASNEEVSSRNDKGGNYNTCNDEGNNHNIRNNYGSNYKKDNCNAHDGDRYNNSTCNDKKVDSISQSTLCKVAASHSKVGCVNNGGGGGATS